MKPTRDRPLWFARSVICLLGVLALSLPVQALADGVVPGGVAAVVEDVTETVGDVVEPIVEGAGDVVEPVSETVGDVVEPVTETVGDVVEPVTETAEDVVEPVTETVDEVTDEVAEGVGDAVDEIADVEDGAVDGVTEGVGDAVDEIADTPGDAVGSNPSAPEDERGEHGGGAGPGPPPTEPGRDSIGSPLPVGEAHLVPLVMDRPYSWWEFRSDVLGPGVPSSQTIEDDAGPSDGDPCNTDDQLVCLGLLYGLGDFANTQTRVLSFLAMTGIGVIGLLVLAMGLGIVGSTAVVGSRYRSAASAGRAG